MQVGSSGYVLVIEDQQGIRRLLSEVLRLQGIPVVAVSRGIDGLVAARQQAPDLILVDMNMPSMDGLDTIRAIREEGISAPCHLMTALEQTSRIGEALHLPGVELLPKPFDITVVRSLAARTVRVERC